MARHREFDETEVVQAAMQLFWLNGYRASTPQKLVETTGLSKSSLYATFGNKQGLFLSALDRYIAVQVTQIRGLTAEGSLQQGLARLYDQLIELAVGGHTCLLCSSAVEATLEEGDVADRVRSGHLAIEEVLYERLVRAQAEDELAEDRDPRGLARFLVNTNMGLMVLGRVHPERERLLPIATEALRAVG